MSDMRLHILGCGSAVPTPRHNPSCQVLERRGELMMIDCGEGAQSMMRRMRLRYSRLRHIFISHLHGDHCFGLPGLLSTMALHEAGGTVTVHILREGADLFARMMEQFCGPVSYRLEWDILDPAERRVIVDRDDFTVESFPLYHRGACCGLLFREKAKPRHLLGDIANFYGVPHYRRQEIRMGADFVMPDGTVIPNDRLTREADPALSYAYCSDTMAAKRVAKVVEGVDTLYHEATYGDDNAALARKRGHSTARQAGEIAAMAGARRLVIGHYSKRYNDEEQLRREAASVFAGQVIAANEGMTIDLGNGDIAGA